jgi:hypothetical protein
MTMTRIRTMRGARLLGRRPRLLAEMSGRGDWRGTGDVELRSHDDCVVLLRIG